MFLAGAISLGSFLFSSTYFFSSLPTFLWSSLDLFLRYSNNYDLLSLFSSFFSSSDFDFYLLGLFGLFSLGYKLYHVHAILMVPAFFFC